MRWPKAMLDALRSWTRSDPWGPFDAPAWRDLPHVAGRLATEADVKAGRAVFYLADGDGPATPHEMTLPALAILHEENGDSQPIVIIQAERSGDRVIVGFRFERGGNGAATLEEIELRPNQDTPETHEPEE